MDIDRMIEIIDRHLGEAGEIEITNNKGEMDRLKISSLPTGDIGKAFSTTKLITLAQGNILNIFDGLTPEMTELITELGIKMLRPNYPNIGEEKLKRLVMKNLLKFLMEIWNQLNVGVTASVIRPDKSPFGKAQVGQTGRKLPTNSTP